MRTSVLWGIIPPLVVVLAGAPLVVRPPVPWRTRSGRLSVARDQLRETLGPLGAWVALCGAGLALAVAVLWPLGRLAYRLEGAWDRPVYDWFRDHQAGAAWTRANEILTLMGDRQLMYGITAVAMVVLALLAPRRRWAPPFIAGMAILIEQVVRVGLLKVVDRGHPPTSEGTWPSGGVGRIIAIYGMLLFLLLWCAAARGGRIGRIAAPRTVAVAGVVLAAMATVEGYTRLYLLKHWLTDVLGGYVFGALLLAVLIYAGRALLDVRPPPPGQDVKARARVASA
jgi:membrane-associated phospholipid phosphatase